MDEEIFRDIKGFENLYQVSNYGNVKSLISGVIMKQSVGPSGRLVVGLSIPIEKRKRRYDGQKTFVVYRLVAKAFPEICGEWFEGCHIHHIDGNYLNNRADNLKCITAEEHLAIHHPKKKKVFPYMFN